MLIEPEWVRPARERRVFDGLPVLEGEERVELEDGEREHFLAAAAPEWDRRFRHLRLLAQLGPAAIPALLEQAAEGLDADLVEVLARVASPRIAPAMARAMSRAARSGERAREWLARHPAAAAAGLIPAAVGAAEDAARAQAVLALRRAAQSDRAAVLSEALRHGPEVASEVAALLDGPPPLPRQLPRLPPSWKVGEKLPPRLRAGPPLPAPAVEHLGTLLALSADAPFPGLDEVKEACDPASLESFALALFDAWRAAGAKSQHRFALTALAHVGGEAAARRVGGAIRSFLADGDKARAADAIEVLARIGSDLALAKLADLAARERLPKIRERASRWIEAAAAERGLSREDLRDRLVPDFGLDASGSLLLDFGPRRFRACFDESLTPYARDESGARLAELPRPRKSDDPERAAQAVAVWKGLKKDVRAVASSLRARLEDAMCSQRPWRAPDFQQLFAAHPLTRNLARGLVWSRVDGPRPVFFRVAEDGTLADEDDALFSLDAAAQVVVAHRLRLSDAEAARWSARFADYEILQPFPQLGREIFRPTEEERSARALLDVSGAQVSPGRLFALEARGYRLGPAEDGGMRCSHEKPLDPQRTVRIRYEPGFFVGGFSGAAEAQTLGEVVVEQARPLPPRGTFGELGDLEFSELKRDLMLLRR